MWLTANPDPQDRKHAQAVFANRNYSLTNSHAEPGLLQPRDLLAVDAVVLSQDPKKPLAVTHILPSASQTILNCGCTVVVRLAAGLGAMGRSVVVQTIVDSGLPAAGMFAEERNLDGVGGTDLPGVVMAPCVYIWDQAVGWEQIATLIAENSAGAPLHLNTTIVARDAQDKTVALEVDDRLLVHRAFPDSSRVELQRMPDGLSGGFAYRAQVTPTQGLLGPKPYFYFVKLGDRKQIVSEFSSYEGGWLEYVPFHLSPRLRLDRCWLGARRGILVADLVDVAEPFLKHAIEGRGKKLVDSLFERTLHSWHECGTEMPQSVPEALFDQYPAKVPQDREALIQALGGTPDLQQLRELLVRSGSRPVLMGPMHGDLHANNVLVRGTDAVVIDFEKFRVPKPLVYDAASLEGGLLVDGFIDDRRTVSQILKSVMPLYRDGVWLDQRKHAQRHPLATWFYDCVRQIRRRARPLEFLPGQYASALALALIKKAANENVTEKRRVELRAMAWVIAEVILKKHTSQPIPPRQQRRPKRKSRVRPR